MRRFAPWIAVVLIYAMTPMAAEVTENLVHLATEGHLAHAAPGHAHAPDDVHESPHEDEHGCSPSFHVCGCHTAGFLVTDLGCVLPRAHQELAGAAWREDRAPEGYRQRLLRPPIVG